MVIAFSYPWLKPLEKAENSGFTNDSKEEILKQSKNTQLSAK